MSHAILGIHGLANKPPRQVQHQGWIDAMQEGLRRNCGLESPKLDFASVYWADIVHPKPLTRDKEPYLPAAGTGPLKTYRDGWLTDLGAEVIGLGGKAIDVVKRWFGGGDLAEAVLRRKLRDLHLYNTDTRVRQALQKRLRDALAKATGGRIMLIAHSMGSIIAYDVLRDLGRENPRFVLDHFVTIGSPLGLPQVKATIHGENRVVRTPTVVRQWTNFADRCDPVAVDVHLADDFQPNDAGVRVHDDLVINGYRSPKGDANHHKLYGYLRAPEVSTVIARFI